MTSNSDKGAMLVNDNFGAFRKIAPVVNNQVPISNNSLPFGVAWGRLTAAQIDCNETLALATPINNQVDDYDPPSYDALTTAIITSGGVGVAWLTGIVPKGQCYLILVNGGAVPFTLLNNNGGSFSINRFTLSQPTLEIKPREAVYLYYSNHLSRWVAVSSYALYLDDLIDVETNGGIGNTTGDRLTFVKNSAMVGSGGYPFIIAPIEWTNISVISGAIAFEDAITPLVVVIGATNTPYLIPFVGVIQPGAFLISTNGLGRLQNDDSFTWSFNINFSCSITGGSNSEWILELYIDGAPASNAYYTTVANNNKYTSVTGVWTQQLRGSSVTAGPTNQYCEIFVTRAAGSTNATFSSCYLSLTGVKLLDRP